ncbi:MAG: hypothetical protein WCH43_15065 [Verrucomicrobiota bacterium]
MKNSPEEVSLEKFVVERLPALCVQSGDPDAGYALPPSSLEALGRIVRERGITKVFEFGSGRSTRMFLENGCEVAILENDPAWLEETLGSLEAGQRSRLDAVCRPQGVVFHRGTPFRSWAPDAWLIAKLSEAGLVLVDSPACPPFREHALLLSLRYMRPGGLIVVDDARIPTVRRFCTRLAEKNGLGSYYSGIDHGLCFFAVNARQSLKTARGLAETAKAWRRFFKLGGPA